MTKSHKVLRGVKLLYCICIFILLLKLYEKSFEKYLNMYKIFFLNQIKSFIILAVIRRKRVASWQGPSPRHCARTKQLLSKKCSSGGEPLVSDLTGPRFESQTSRFRDERVTARHWFDFRSTTMAIFR